MATLIPGSELNRDHYPELGTHEPRLRSNVEKSWCLGCAPKDRRPPNFSYVPGVVVESKKLGDRLRTRKNHGPKTFSAEMNLHQLFTVELIIRSVVLRSVQSGRLSSVGYRWSIVLFSCGLFSGPFCSEVNNSLLSLDKQRADCRFPQSWNACCYLLLSCVVSWYGSHSRGQSVIARCLVLRVSFRTEAPDPQDSDLLRWRLSGSKASSDHRAEWTNWGDILPETS
jgi:hypothetical protein